MYQYVVLTKFLRLDSDSPNCHNALVGFLILTRCHTIFVDWYRLRATVRTNQGKEQRMRIVVIPGKANVYKETHGQRWERWLNRGWIRREKEYLDDADRTRNAVNLIQYLLANQRIR